MEKLLSPITRKWFQDASDKKKAAVIELGYQSLQFIHNQGEQLNIEIALQRIEQQLIGINQPKHYNYLPNIDGLNKTMGSSEKGQIGENYIYKILENKYDIKQISQTARFTDLIINNKILTEVKYYKSTVPSKEIVKFKRDLAARSAQGGLFISLDSKIAGKKHFELEFLVVSGQKIPVIYVHTNLKDVLFMAIDVLLFQIEQPTVAMHDTIVEKISEIANSLEGISLSRSYLNDLSLKNMREINRIMQLLMETELKIKQSLEQMRKKIQPSIKTAQPLDIATIKDKFVMIKPQLVLQVAEQILSVLHKDQYITSNSISVGSYGLKFYKTKTLFLANIAEVQIFELIKEHPSLVTIKNNMLSIEITDFTINSILDIFHTCET